jgi:hypothetical protein
MIVQRDTCLPGIRNITGLSVAIEIFQIHIQIKSFHEDVSDEYRGIFSVSCTPDYQFVVVAIVLPRTQFFSWKCHGDGV